MILDELEELKNYLEKGKTDALKMSEAKFKDYKAWREHYEEKCHDLYDLQKIIQYAQTFRKDTAEY
jgi:hypothetical protein